MKTAMQELISDLTYHIKTQSSEWKKDPVAMLHQIDAMYFGNAIEKEKQQIIDAHAECVRIGTEKENSEYTFTKEDEEIVRNDIEEYYNKTFKVSHS